MLSDLLSDLPRVGGTLPALVASFRRHGSLSFAGRRARPLCCRRTRFSVDPPFVAAAGSYDAVVSWLTVLHFDKAARDQLLKQSLLLLRPGGAFFAEDFCLADAERPGQHQRAAAVLRVPCCCLCRDALRCRSPRLSPALLCAHSAASSLLVLCTVQ